MGGLNIRQSCAGAPPRYIAPPPALTEPARRRRTGILRADGRDTARYRLLAAGHRAVPEIRRHLDDSVCKSG